MKEITLQEFLDDQPLYLQEARAGKIFIYPTDTVYGIGWLYKPPLVEKIFAIKEREPDKMFSIIAPSFEWIENNYGNTTTIDIDILKKYLDIYHGVTYIFTYERPWVRILKHPFQSFVEVLGEPFITTSCNVADEPPLNDLQNLSPELKSKVDYIIDGGILPWKPSVLIDLVENKIIER